MNVLERRGAGREGAVLLAATFVLAALVLVLRDIPVFSPTTVALILLLVVICTATLASRGVSIVIALLAMLLFNFFFLPPVGTFTIADPHNWVALLAFLAVAAIAIERMQILREREAAAAVRQKAELTSTLLASLSHDLRTPLTAIRVAVENLQDEAPAAYRREQANAALSELDRLTRLFQDILDMARIETEALVTERQWVTPSDIVDAGVAHVRPQLERRRLDIEADSETEVEVDPRLTSRALAQLLENAARYSPPEEPIAVSATADSEGVRITVTDCGQGLSPEDLSRLFEPFFRGRSAAGTAGTGMGLAITRGLLAAEGGRVWARNEDPRGSSFTIVVPGARRPAPTAV